MSTISSSTTSSTAYKVAADTTGTLVFQTGATPTTAVTIDGSQNVLVGGTTQYGAAKITISNGGAYLALNSTSGGYSLIRGFDSGTERWAVGQIGFGGTDGMAFYTGASSTERARIDTSGNLLVGDTTNTAGARIKAYSAGQSIWATSTSTSAGNVVVYIENYQAAASNRYFMTGGNNAGDAIRIATNGNVTNTNNSYGAISDVKLKENITDATPKLDGLMQVRVVNYNLIGDENKQLGVVAQELEQIFPALIEESPDYEQVTTTDEEGNEITERMATGTTTKSVKYSVFVPMLIKALQEQQALITQLQADVAALKGAA